MSENEISSITIKFDGLLIEYVKEIEETCIKLKEFFAINGKSLSEGDDGYGDDIDFSFVDTYRYPCYIKITNKYARDLDLPSYLDVYDALYIIRNLAKRKLPLLV